VLSREIVRVYTRLHFRCQDIVSNALYAENGRRIFGVAAVIGSGIGTGTPALSLGNELNGNQRRVGVMRKHVGHLAVFGVAVGQNELDAI